METETGSINPEQSRIEDVRQLAIANLDRSLQDPKESALRDHQHSMLESLKNFLASGESAGYMSEPTGVGKTAVIVTAAEAMGLKTLILTPTQQILQQTSDAAQQFTPDLDITNFYADEKDLSGRVINTTYQSLVRLLEAKRKNKSSGGMQSFDPNEIELVICDEAHLALGEKRHTIFQDFPNALLVGLTATPDFSPIEGYIERGIVAKDDLWLGLFQNNIHEMTLEEAIERKILTELDIYMLQTNTSVADIHVSSSGEYRRSDVEKFFNTKERNALILAIVAGVENVPNDVRLHQAKAAELEEIHKKIDGKRTMVFVSSVAQADEIMCKLNELGISASSFHGEIKRDKRKNILEKHTSGEVQVLVGVDMMGLGVDSPATEVSIHADPTRSGVRKTQQLGRVLRQSPQTGKDRAIAIDLVDRIKNPVKAPVLLPQIFDPEYILRGTRTGFEKASGKTIQRERPLITFSGMEIDAIVEQVKIQQLLKTRFKQADITETASLLDNLVEDVEKEHPDASMYEISQELLGMLPERIPKEAYQHAIQAVASLDPNTRSIGKNVFLWLNLKTAIGLVDTYSSDYDSDEERDELLQTALTAIVEIPSWLRNTISVSQQVHLAARKAIVNYIAQRDNVSTSIAWEIEYPKTLSKILGVVSDIQYTLSGEEREQFIKQTSEELNIDEGIIREILSGQVSLADYVEENHAGLAESTLEDEFFTRELKSEVANILDLLSERERQVIIMRFGLDTGQERTLKEVGQELGLGGARVGQIVAKVLQKLRHPSRGKKLENFYDDLPAPSEIHSYVSPFRYKSAESPIHREEEGSFIFHADKYTKGTLEQGGFFEIGDFFQYNPDDLCRKVLEMLPSGDVKARIRNFIPKDVSLIDNDIVSGLGVRIPRDWEIVNHIVEGVLERDDYQVMLSDLTPLQQKLVQLYHGTFSIQSLTPEEQKELRDLGKLGRGLMNFEARQKIFHRAYEELSSYLDN